MTKKSNSDDAKFVYDESPRVVFCDAVPSGLVTFLQDLPIDPVRIPWDYGATPNERGPIDVGDFEAQNFSVTKSGGLKPAAGYEYGTRRKYLGNGEYVEEEVRYVKTHGNYLWAATHGLHIKI